MIRYSLKKLEDLTLELPLSELLKNLENDIGTGYDSYEKLSIIVGRITKDYPAFTKKHANIDWSSLSKLNQLTTSSFTPYYPSLKAVINQALSTEIKIELSNLKIEIININSNSFYKSNNKVTPHLTSLCEFSNDLDVLYKLKCYLSNIDVNGLNYQMTNHSIFTHAPKCYGRQVSANSSDSIGEIHNVMVMAEVGEMLIKLSPKLQQLFGQDLIDQVKQARNNIFHPERTENWTIFKKFIDINPGDFFLKLVKQYEIASEIMHFFANRSDDREQLQEFSIEFLFDSEDKFRKIVLNTLDENSRRLYKQDNYLTAEEIWNYIKSGLAVSRVLSHNVEDKAESALQHLNEKHGNIHSLSLKKVSEPDLKQVEEVYPDGNTLEGQNLKKYFTLKYHVLLKGKTNSKEDIEVLIETLKKSDFEAKHQKILATPESESDNWEVWEKMLLIQKLINCRKNLNKQSKILNDNKSKYHEAKSKPENSLTDEDKKILQDYEYIQSLYEKGIKSESEKFESLLLIDTTYEKRNDLFQLDRASKLLPKLEFALDKIIEHSKDAYNPSPIAVFTQSVGSIYSTVEFYMMIAGSLARSYLDITGNHRSTILHDLSKEITEILTTLQEIRGTIAHVNEPKSYFDHYCSKVNPYVFYAEQANACLKLISKLDLNSKIMEIKLTIEGSTESELAVSQNLAPEYAIIVKDEILDSVIDTTQASDSDNDVNTIG